MSSGDGMDEHVFGRFPGPAGRSAPLTWRGSVREASLEKAGQVSRDPKLSLKGHTVRIVGFMDHMVSVSTIHLCFTKAAIGGV